MNTQPVPSATDRWHRELAIRTALTSRGQRPHPHLAFAAKMALELNATVEASDCFLSQFRSRVIWTPPIVSDADLACFAHECGHLADVDNEGRPREAEYDSHDVNGRTVRRVSSIEGEIVAWEWAIRTLNWRWNQGMDQRMREAIYTYHWRYDLDAETKAAWLALHAESAARARPAIRIIRAAQR